MDRRTFIATAALPALLPLRSDAQTRHTEVTIRGDAFLINGRPTYAGTTFEGKRIEGLLMNVRVVQGIFDDLNAETAPRWVYPDTKRWDADRNTREFVAIRTKALMTSSETANGAGPRTTVSTSSRATS